MSSIPARDSRPYEVVVWGATGFTGALVAEYLCGAGRKSAEGRPPLKWALAGRSAKKLGDVAKGLKIDSQVAEVPALIIADSDDSQSLQKMTAQTRVVICMVGPYAKYGEPLVAACIKNGTDYCDITGESHWVAAMIEKYSEAAAKSGSLLVSMCGFDSVPADLSAFMAADYMRSKHQVGVSHMQGYMSGSGGGISGGTIASAMNMRDSPPQEKHSPRKPYLLNPAGYVPARTRVLEKDQLFPRWDPVMQTWTTPFFMAIVNTRVVRRSLALRRQLERETDGFGEQAAYNECMSMPNLFYALVVWFVLVIAALFMTTKFTRRLANMMLPQPGEGPSLEKRLKARFTHRVIATSDDSKEVPFVVESKFGGTDPGYTETSRMISEMGLLLAEERGTLPIQALVQGRTAVQGPVGGFFTPSIVGGQRFVERLRGAGMRLEVGDFVPRNKNSSANKNKPSSD